MTLTLTVINTALNNNYTFSRWTFIQTDRETNNWIPTSEGKLATFNLWFNK